MEYFSCNLIVRGNISTDLFKNKNNTFAVAVKSYTLVKLINEGLKKKNPKHKSHRNREYGTHLNEIEDSKDFPRYLFEGS